MNALERIKMGAGSGFDPGAIEALGRFVGESNFEPTLPAVALPAVVAPVAA